MENKLSRKFTLSIVSLALTLLFLFELYITTDSLSLYIGPEKRNAFIEIFYESIKRTPSMILPLVSFLVVQLVLHIAFILFNYKLYKALLSFYINNFVKNNLSKLEFVTSFLFLNIINYFCILIINNYYYPYSSFSQNFFSSIIAFIIAIIWLSITVLIVSISLIRKHTQSNFILLFILLSAFGYISYTKFVTTTSPLKFTNNNTGSPNVILVTLDSFRADYIDKINSVNNQYLDIPKFINNSVHFTNTYTPLGRSFPALYSILSGKYPKAENIRFNLSSQHDINYKELLPSILTSNNYESLYTTDSNQFHIINAQWGYKFTATPRQGIYEHILPKLQDLPLSNLIFNYPISESLFPYTYSNQAAMTLYSPFTYVNRIQKNISKLNKNKPVFLHLNFEGAHWPYQNRDINPNNMYQNRYLYSVNTVNWQVNQVFKYLTTSNLLDNSIVIIASDHGEALGLKGDKLTNRENYIGESRYLSYISKYPVNYTFDQIKDKNILDYIIDINSSGGHGIDVLSSSQYKVVLGMQKFYNGQSTYNNQKINTPVVLIDIYHTILDLVNLKKDNINTSSISLKDILTKNKTSEIYNTLTSRNIFIETGLQVPYFDVKEVNDKNIMNKFINTWSKNYHIKSNLLLELKPEAVNDLLKTKQYAVANNGHILAYIPSGIKQNWKVIKTTETTPDNITCDLPRPIFDEDGVKLATLCGYYKDSKGYYVYYNGNQNTWQIYISEVDFQDNIIALNLYDSLVNQYPQEIKKLNTLQSGL